MSIRLARYTYFVQDFFSYYLPYHYSVDQKKLIFEKFMDFTIQNLDKKEKIETVINISHHIIYPMLVHSNKLAQVPLIVDKKKYVEFFSSFNVPRYTQLPSSFLVKLLFHPHQTHVPLLQTRNRNPVTLHLAPLLHENRNYPIEKTVHLIRLEIHEN